MTDNIEKFRSLFMAALMVVSVVALSASLAGTAAAGVSTADRSVSDSSPSPGDDVTVTTTVEMDSSGGALAVTDTFSPSVESASIQSIEINGQGASLSQIASSGADSGAATVTLQNVPGDATVDITYTITTADQANQQYEITGTATSGNTDADVGSTTITTAGSQDDDDDQDDDDQDDSGLEGAALNSGATFYTGQDVYVEGLNPNQEYTVNPVDDNEPQSLEQALTADSDGNVEFELSSGLSDGEFVLLDNNGDVVPIDDGTAGSAEEPNEDNTRDASFNVVAMDLSADFDEASVGNDGGSSTVEWEVESDKRNTYNVNVTADGDLDVGELEDIFGDEATVVETYEDDDTIEITQSGSSTAEGTYELDFQDIDAGTYTFEASAADADASDSDDIDVTDTGDASADFGTSFITEQRGDVANITVTMQNTDEATVQVGNIDNSGYAITALVTDDDEDGVAYVEFNSFTAGSPDTTLTAGDEDTELSDIRSPSGSYSDNDPAGSDLIDDFDYDMFVAEGDVSGTLDSNSADNSGALNLEEGSIDNLQVWTAPEEIGSDLQNEDVEDIGAYVQAGNLTRTNSVAESDTVVVQVEGSGLEGALENGDATELYGDTSAEGALFNLTFEGESVVNGPDADANIADLGEGNYSVLYNGTADTHYVVLDSDALIDQFDHESGDEYTANFSVFDDNSDLVDEDVSVTQDFDIEEPELELDTDENDMILLPADDGAEVDGDTNLAPGTEVEVSLESDTSTDPFVKRPEATVQADGTFTATADFEENEPGTNFTAQAVVGDVDSDEYDGQLTDETVTEPTPTTTSETPTEPPTTTTEPPTETTTEPPEMDPSPTATATSGGDDGGDETTTSGSGPGFTAALALIALVAAALLAVRRNN